MSRMRMVFVLIATVAMTLQASGQEKLTVKGETKPLQEKKSEFGAKVPGHITKIHYRVGQTVKKGDLLITLNPTPEDVVSYERQLDVVNIALAGAKDNFELADRSWKRVQKLGVGGAISQEEYDIARNGYKTTFGQLLSAEKMLAKAKADLESAKARYDLNFTYAETSGVVTDSVASLGRSCYTRDRLGIVVDLSELEVEAKLPFKYRSVVEIGEKVTVRQEQYEGNLEVQGEINYINPLTRDGYTPVRIRISNADLRLGGYDPVDVVFTLPAKTVKNK